jgi:hypothetical protein
MLYLVFYCNRKFIVLLADIRLGLKCKPVINSLTNRAKPDFTIVEVFYRGSLTVFIQ